MLAAASSVARTATVLAFAFFVATLVAADWSLRRWGSAAIRRRPRPGARVTVIFLGVVVVCGVLELVAVKVWSHAPALSVVLLVLQLAAAPAVAVGIDRAVS